MGIFTDSSVLVDRFREYGRLHQDSVVVHDADGLRQRLIDDLVHTSVFGSGDVQQSARWLIWEIAQELGCRPASIHDYYIAGGRGVWGNQTTPAINVRAMTYDVARTIFRTMRKIDAGQVIFEIARSEMGYTSQRPDEYATSVLAAAIREGHSGPVFIQGDHFQLNAKGFRADPEKEMQGVRDLIEEAVAAGFFNIDIDTSTIVDISLDGEDAQQAENARRSAELTECVRACEPREVTVSVGAEIGEVGSHNSTVAEQHAFMRAYHRDLSAGLTGISKISVQTGTSHGGIVLPDGTIAKVKVDFDTLGELSKAARERYGLAGAVQHGASTLPEEAFNRFAEANACEVHLATGFQNIIYDSPAFPADLLATMYAYLDEKHPDERKEGMTDAQFQYTARKRALGPFKSEMWNLPEDARATIMSELADRFELIFTRLSVAGTRALVHDLTPLPRVERKTASMLSDVMVEGE